MARYASWGGRPSPDAPQSADRVRWEEACAAAWLSGDPAQAWRRADAMLRDTAWRLLSRGRGGSGR